MTDYNYERELFRQLNALKASILYRPLTLGGVSASGGGDGGPPGGFIGYLPQTRVAYDESELESITIPASGASLFDNLNHIRARLSDLEAGGTGDIPSPLSVLEEGIIIASGVSQIDFSGATVTTTPSGVLVTIDTPTIPDVPITTSGAIEDNHLVWDADTSKYVPTPNLDIDHKNIVLKRGSIYTEYAGTDAGLDSVLSIIQDGDIVYLPAVTFTELHTIPTLSPVNAKCTFVGTPVYISSRLDTTNTLPYPATRFKRTLTIGNSTTQFKIYFENIVFKCGQETWNYGYTFDLSDARLTFFNCFIGDQSSYPTLRTIAHKTESYNEIICYDCYIDGQSTLMDDVDDWFELHNCDVSFNIVQTSYDGNFINTRIRSTATVDDVISTQSHYNEFNDRAAFFTVNDGEAYHCQDIYVGEPVLHTPIPTDAGQTIVSSGGFWTLQSVNTLLSYEFIQGVPAATWNIAHNLNRYPSVTVIDSANTVVIGDVSYTDANNIVVTFSSAFSGKAELN